MKKENSRLGVLYSAVCVNGYIFDYWYDAAGERTVKTSGESQEMYVNSLFSGGDTQTANFTAYVNPYLVVSKAGQYTKHIYIGSQRIVSKLGDLDSYGADPRRIEYAGTGVDGAKVDYKAKYTTQQQIIKDRYAKFEVPYYGKDNDDYVNGQGFCCDDNSTLKSFSAGQNDNPELYQYYYHSDHLGSSSLITNLDGEVVQHIEYVPFGEVFIEERNNRWNTPYLFNAKELDEETGLYYYGARYYDPRVSIWLSTDPLQEKYPNKTSYHYCSNNPINRIDPTGLEDHVDDYGKVIARYDNDDKSVYMHTKGTTQEQIEKHRKDNIFNGGIGTKIGKLGGEIDASTIMKNKLSQTAKEATGMGVRGYFNAVKPGAKWDLKANEQTIFGIAWSSDKDNGTKTTFSFDNYSEMSAADVGNYHAGYAGRYTTISRYNLLKGAGVAETVKSFLERRIGEGFRRLGGLLNPFNEQSGDRPVDYKWNTQGMNDASWEIMQKTFTK